jgi:serine protease
VREVTAAGVLVVVSAGNDGAAVTSPGNCAGVLAVAGIRHAGTKVGYSNLGSEVGIAAPAGNCVTTVEGDPCVYALNTTTNLGTQGPGAEGYSSPLVEATFGTSFSAPLVAGTAGLMKAVNPTLTPAQIITRIKASARPFPTGGDDTAAQLPTCVSPTEKAPGEKQNSPCICTTAVCGAGMLDAEHAVLEAQRPVALATLLGVVRAGGSLTLDGSQSAAATGRSITGWQWVVESSTAASIPVISNANLPVATIDTPMGGSTVVRLTIRDNLGASDSASITIAGAIVTSSSPPSTPAAPTRGGGGDAGALLLPLLALLGARRLRRSPVA